MCTSTPVVRAIVVLSVVVFPVVTQIVVFSVVVVVIVGANVFVVPPNPLNLIERKGLQNKGWRDNGVVEGTAKKETVKRKY